MVNRIWGMGIDVQMCRGMTQLSIFKTENSWRMQNVQRIVENDIKKFNSVDKERHVEVVWTIYRRYLIQKCVFKRQDFHLY